MGLNCGLLTELLVGTLTRRQIQHALHVFPFIANLDTWEKLHRKKTTDPSVICTENFVPGIVRCRGYFCRGKERTAVSPTLCKRKGADRGMGLGLGLEFYMTSIYAQKNKRKAKCPTQHSFSSLSLCLFSKQ